MQVSGHTHKITAFVTIFNILYKDWNSLSVYLAE
jgi:hypothetical protein